MTRVLSRPGLRRALRAAFAVAVAFFVWLALRGQWEEVRAGIGDLSWLSATVGLVGVVGAVLATMLSWRALLADMGSPLPVPAMVRIFALGQLGKYVPGSVWSLVGQVELGRDYSVPRARMATASLLAIAVGIVTAFLVAAATLPFLVVGEGREWLWVLWLLPLGVAVLHPRVLRPVLNAALRAVRREPLADVPSVRGLLVSAAWGVVLWLCYGLHAWLLAVDLGATGGADVLALGVGGFALAWALGFLFVVAPAGAGIREGVLVLTIGTVLPLSAAALLAVVSRLLVTVGDLLWAGAAVVMARRARPG